MGTSKCGSDMQFISIFHLIALLHTPPAAMKDLWLEWLYVMVASVLSEKAPMQLAFYPYLFLVSRGHKGSDVVVQPFNEGNYYINC